MSPQRPHFSPHSKAKANYKSTNLRILVTSGISDVAIISVYSEKTCMKKCLFMVNMIIIEKPFTSK